VPTLRLWLVLLTLAGATAWGAAALALWQTTVPGDLNLPQFDPAQYLSGAEIERATDYQRFLGINALLAALAQLVALGIFAARGARFARESAAGRIGTGMLLGMLALAFVWIAQFPFALAATWWQRRYDISDLGYLDWAIGYWMQAGGKFLFISLALLLVMALAGRWPRGWWLGAAPALVVIMGMLAFTTPYLMFELKPLRDEGVAADAQRLAEAQDVSDTPVFVVDTLGLTSAPNAGAAGLGPSERVIVWDNLLERFERSETEIVLAHELAHLSRGHIAKKIACLALLAIPIAFIAQRTTRSRGGWVTLRRCRSRSSSSPPCCLLPCRFKTPSRNGSSRRRTGSRWSKPATPTPPPACFRVSSTAAWLRLIDPGGRSWQSAPTRASCGGSRWPRPGGSVIRRDPAADRTESSDRIRASPPCSSRIGPRSGRPSRPGWRCSRPRRRQSTCAWDGFPRG